MKTLYKKDSKGKVRVLHISTEGAELIQQSGLENGALVEHRKVAKAKNIGKSNATTPEQQAEIEAEAKYVSKLDEGYFETREEALTEEVLLPMLAKDYKKELTKINWGSYVFVQPKLDGMRCLAVIRNGVVSLMSRGGKAISTMQHIVEELTGLEDQILDGELYAHGISFQENMKLLKKYRPGESEKVTYNVYDKIVPNTPFYTRYKEADTLIINNEFKSIKIVSTFRIKEEKEVAQYQTKFLAAGYEGTMVRHGNEEYKVNGRSSQLLKYKDFSDATFTVLDVKPSDANPKQGVLCLVSGTQEFRASLKMSHAEREEILTNKDNYIGQTAEIRFFELTDGGLPRFPVCVGFRIDK